MSPNKQKIKTSFQILQDWLSDFYQIVLILGTCFKPRQMYINECIKMESSINQFQLAPFLCKHTKKANIENKIWP